MASISGSEIDWTKWIVDLCKTHSLVHQCDFYSVTSAKEAVMIQKGCHKCSILIPEGEEL